MYEVPVSKASIKQNKFEFKSGAKTYSLPKLQYLSLNQMAPFESIGDQSTTSEIVDAFKPISAEVARVVGGFDTEQFRDFFAAWRDASDVAVGESKAS